MDKQYDYLILGSGPAGYVSAIRAAQSGLKVAVVEKDPEMFGGVCLNEGCIPAKSLFHSAEIIDTVRKNWDICGLKCEPGSIDMSRMVAKSREAREQLCKGLSFLFSKNGIEIIYGTGCFVDRETVSITGVGGEQVLVKAKKFLISTGSGPKVLPGVPVDGKIVITSSEAIRLDNIPENILIVGAGAIGIEFASFFNILGSKTTLVEMGQTVLPLEDKEVGKRMKSISKQNGIEVLTGSIVEKVSTGNGAAEVVINFQDNRKDGTYEKVLIATGRVPAVSGIGIDKLGMDMDEKGFIRVDTRMRTSVENIYAAGDVVNSPMLAHVAYAEGEVAAVSAAGKEAYPVDYGCIPNAVYSNIRAASVGANEEQLKSGGVAYKAGKQFFKSNGRAVANSRTEGFIKVLAQAETRKLLGAHIVGYEADELIHEFALAKRMSLTVDDIGRTVHAHPTFSETAVDACRSVFGKPVHG